MDDLLYPWRELDKRYCDGLEISLLWSPDHISLVVEVIDRKVNITRTIAVAPQLAKQAFEHPFCFI